MSAAIAAPTSIHVYPPKPQANVFAAEADSEPKSNTTSVAAPVDGTVESHSIKVGSTVKKGDTLIVITPSQFVSLLPVRG